MRIIGTMALGLLVMSAATGALHAENKAAALTDALKAKATSAVKETAKEVTSSSAGTAVKAAAKSAVTEAARSAVTEAAKSAVTEAAKSAATKAVKAEATEAAAGAAKAVAATDSATEISKSAVPDALKTPQGEISYCIGVDIANSLKNIPSTLDMDTVIMGLRDKYLNNKTLLSDDQITQIKADFSKRMQEEMMAKQEKDALVNKDAGAKFLEENKAKKGVTTTASGLQYEVIKEGDGPSPRDTDTVKVHYRGTLIDGTEFDSSHKRGKPATFPVNRVIKGWTEALQLMKVGSVCKLVIPSDLAYGSRGAGNLIGPDATLIFEVELLGIE